MEHARRGMIQDLIERGLVCGPVLESMSRVPRHLFVSEALRFNAYRDNSIPIGHGQTASKPSIIARMLQALMLTGRERVLEVGTGSGYQTALLAELAASVVSVERVKELSIRARQTLIRLNYTNAKVINTDDFMGLEGSFDAVIVSAGAESLPEGILSKVRDGGVLVIPLGRGDGHSIRRFTKRDSGEILEEELWRATFVPLIMSPSSP
ncbi:MAG: protein-L-isoaspartate(D-aspartate) O-methyltransferase [Spirochaetes bacterium]|nr:protein-L-isoaspartate(D-aspartate) O-methyltransferase [Spirochaetota bacterium]